MNATTQINQRIQLLPKELQEEVLQFIDYLLFKKKTSESKTGTSNLTGGNITIGESQSEPKDIDYKQYYGIIQPPMGIEKIDHLIAEMRED